MGEVDECLGIVSELSRIESSRIIVCLLGSSWNADDGLTLQNILGDNGTCTDDGILAHRHVFENRTACANVGA